MEQTGQDIQKGPDMKRSIVIMLLCAALTASLAAGCGSGRSPSSDEGRDGQESAVEEIPAEEEPEKEDRTPAAEDEQAGQEAGEKEETGEEEKGPEDVAGEEEPEDFHPSAELEEESALARAAAAVFNFEYGDDVTVEDPEKIAHEEESRTIERPEGVADTLYGDDAVMQIVILGDSQFGNFLGEDGMAYLLKERCKANVYNLAMGGTAAAMLQEDNWDYHNWESRCMNGMVNAICGLVKDTSFFEKYEYTYSVYQACDFKKTDCFILAYGVNDYFQKTPLSDETNWTNPKTFAGAYEDSIQKLRTYYPDAKILVCTPTYAQFFQGGTGAYLGDSNVLSNGFAVLRDYGGVAEAIANSHKNTKTANCYKYAEISSVNAADTLLDGIHMSAEGRLRCANYIAREVLRQQGYKLEQGVDPSQVDWLSTKKKN